MPRHTVLAGAPLLIAHRGGSGLAPENTLTAFRSAADVWAADMIELDVHATADRRCVVIHDPAVDRTTNGAGTVARLTLAELQALDAGHRFTRDGGATFPFRDRGVRIPTIDEVLEVLPTMRFTIEVKAAAAQTPLFAAIERSGARDRVIAAGMHVRNRTQFPEYRGAVSASVEELRRYYVKHRLGLGRWTRPRADVVQIPEEWDGRRVISQRLVRDLAAQGVPVHVWTIDDPADMHRLLDWGVEGLITDRPDTLAAVLYERVARPLPPGLAASPPE
ncbi:MAG: glycerophosphodiester phosphodiesterase [Gemmatimonadota bacterium]